MDPETTAWLATLKAHPHGLPAGWPDMTISRLVDLVERQEAEIVRLKRGDFTPEEFQNLCHQRDEKPGCTQMDFAAGCVEYQAKLFSRPFRMEDIEALARAGGFDQPHDEGTPEEPDEDCPKEVIEVRRNEDGTLDEIVASNCTFHLEDMGDGNWWSAIYKDGYSQFIYFTATDIKTYITDWPHEKIVCPECNGRGGLLYEPGLIIDPCSVCKGSGKVDKARDALGRKER